MSRWTDGNAFLKSAISGTRTFTVAVVCATNLSTPDASVTPCRASASSASSSARMRTEPSKNLSATSVAEIWRVDRWNSRTPSLASNSVIERDTIGVDSPRIDAARVKLFTSTTVLKIRNVSRWSISIPKFADRNCPARARELTITNEPCHAQRQGSRLHFPVAYQSADWQKSLHQGAGLRMASPPRSNRNQYPPHKKWIKQSGEQIIQMASAPSNRPRRIPSPFS